jgi:predicted PurR-regulated permease PerM
MAPEPAPPPPPPPEAEPSAQSTGGGLSVDFRTAAVVTLAIIAVFTVLHFGQVFFLPVVIAVLLKFLLAPAVTWFTRFRLPEPVGAALVLVGLLALLVLGAWQLAGPLQGWLERAPQSLAVAGRRMKQVLRQVEQFNRAAEQMEDVTTPGSSDAQEVVVKGPSLSRLIFGTTQTLIVGLLETLLLLYFLLATGDLFLLKVIRVLPALGDKKKAVSIARETASSISAYLGMLCLLNLGLGIVVAIVMWIVGLPNPILWGAAAAVLEFLPYLGAATMAVILTVAGLVSFPDIGHAFLVPGAYLATNFVQSNLISPLLLARRLTLNPVALFVGFLFWFWIWGVAGALLAVPILATFKILCDHVDTLAPMGEFFGR